jgi:hypothetical protein
MNVFNAIRVAGGFQKTCVDAIILCKYITGDDFFPNRQSA